MHFYAEHAFCMNIKVLLIPLYKREGRRDESGSYRRIALVGLTPKTLEKIVKGRVEGFLETSGFPSSSQFAFIQPRSTEPALAHPRKPILEPIVHSNVSLGVILDITAAFYCIEHNIRLTMLRPSDVAQTSPRCSSHNTPRSHTSPEDSQFK